MNLLLLIVLPLAAALLVVAGPASRARTIALWGTLLPVAMFSFIAYGAFDWTHGEMVQLDREIEWLPSLGLSLSLGADSVSMLLIGLTVLLGPVCVACSFTAITTREKTYYAWLLVLQAAMTGVFAAQDLILFYVFFEFTLVPLYVLINLFGSSNRKAAATKFFLFTFTGSLITLAGLAYVAWVYAARTSPGSAWTFSFSALSRASKDMTAAEQAWVFWALMAGFAVKVPLFPLHTWLPLAHTEAPTAGSVILAGVLLKLGTYGIYRFAIGFCPVAAVEYAPVVAVLAIIGIIYAGLVCWVQTDVKKLVAYSSVSHLGFCVLGLFALNVTGLTGSVMYMLNHGLSTGALFLLIGMVYERYHTRSMKELGGLAARMPIWATFMVFFTMASIGLPGLNGFVGEFLCLFGAFQSGSEGVGGGPGNLGPWYAAFAALGLIVTAIYLLFMVGKVVFGPLVEPHHDHHGADRPALPRDLTGREIAVLAPLAVLCVALGLYPTPVLRTLEGPTRDLARSVRLAVPGGDPAHRARAMDEPHDPLAAAAREGAE